MAKSGVALKDVDKGKAAKEFRTSSQYFLPTTSDPILERIDKRVSWLTRVPISHAEYIQVGEGGGEGGTARAPCRACVCEGVPGTAVGRLAVPSRFKFGIRSPLRAPAQAANCAGTAALPGRFYCFKHLASGRLHLSPFPSTHTHLRSPARLRRCCSTSIWNIVRDPASTGRGAPAPQLSRAAPYASRCLRGRSPPCRRAHRPSSPQPPSELRVQAPRPVPTRRRAPAPAATADSAHHDYFDPAAYASNPEMLQSVEHGAKNRLATVFFYLNSLVGEGDDLAQGGGQTNFPRAATPEMPNGGPQPMDYFDCSKGLSVYPQEGKVWGRSVMETGGREPTYAPGGQASPAPRPPADPAMGPSRRAESPSGHVFPFHAVPRSCFP
eukprot:scaffold10708_cov117-Isochrysis_galbana.AAC.5